MNKEKFSDISARVADAESAREGIGTYMEKCLHSTLKHYLCEDESKHEVPLGRYIADVLDTSQIYEVQTGSFRPLRAKIGYYLDNTDYNVCVVMPIYAKKCLAWLDPDSGEFSGERRLSPKKEKPSKLFTELLWLLEYIHDARLSFRLVSLEVEEIKLLNGYGEGRKKKAQKYERIPLSLLDEIEIRSPRDLRALLPFDEGAEVTLADIGKALGLSEGRRRYITVKALTELGFIALWRKDGKKHIYKVK